jgi:ferredoxin
MTHRLRVDPIACTAHGMCAELLPERISLDDWGYPLIAGEPIGPELEDLARRAAAACPTFALSLEREQPGTGRGQQRGAGPGGRR